jgi:HEAT repeat protein
VNFSTIISRLIVRAGIALALGASLSAFADSHDDAVYQHYSRKVTHSKIAYEFDMKFTELSHPATQADVDRGAAVFTFQGVGPARVWKLPKCPIFCEWSSLKDFPFENNASETNFDDFGNILQAEELQVNGRWKLYFGFICKHGTAVVPADEIYLSFNDCDCNSSSPVNWEELPGGTDLGVLAPGRKTQNGATGRPKLNIGDPLLVELSVRNRRGIAQTVLGDIFRDQKNGGPAFHNGMSLFLARAPFNSKNPDPNYPRTEDYKPVDLICSNRFDSARPGPFLATGETQLVATLNLRDWFKVSLPGYYQFHFEFDPAQLGLPTDERNGGGVYFGFVLGTEPRRLTFEELNREIPAFGGLQNETRIRTLIQQSIEEERHSETNRTKGPSLNPGARGPMPTLNYTPFMGDNMSGGESEVVQLSIPNAAFLDGLENYDKYDARRMLETLMRKEKVLPMKLLLSSAAMAKGSATAALFVLECMTNTDYTVARNTQEALGLALNHSGTNPPSWLVEMACAALSDDRYMTGLQNARIDGATNVFSSDTIIKMSYSADENSDLTRALGYSHCTNAVPFLIEMVKKTDGRRGPVMALGTLGDHRAIPILIELVKRKGPSVKQEKDWVLSDDFLRPVQALGNLRAKEAIPALLDYLQYPDVIKALQAIEDPSAIGPLQKLIENNGNIERPGVSNDPEFRQERVAAAKIAAASLDPDNRTLKLCELLAEPSFDQFQRRSVVWALGNHPDSRAIPFLAKAINTDKSGAVVNQAISVMAAFKYKTAVDALIESFDADFRGKQDWKRAYEPEMFRENIADSLKHLTGQQMGADKQQWQIWWRAHRDSTPGLQ